jgi:hypothetical protein
MESSCECGNEPSRRIKALGSYRVATQLMASRVEFSFAEAVNGHA